MNAGSNRPPAAINEVQQQQLIAALQQAARVEDPLFRELAARKISSVIGEAQTLAAGEIVFHNTEAWRAAYERLLQELDFSTYYSVAWVRTSGYWRDQPGLRSIRLNYELLDQGLAIERILILPDDLWPGGAPPSASIRTWIEEQHYRGVNVALVRQSDLFRESDLICDFGVYGTRATGEQLLDDRSRTIQFKLSFQPDAVRRARDRWDRLAVFSISCRQALDLD